MQSSLRLVKMKKRAKRVQNKTIKKINNAQEIAICPECGILIYRWENGWRCPFHGFFEINFT